MTSRREFLVLSLSAIACAAADHPGAPAEGMALPVEPAVKDLPASPAKVEKLVKTDAEWKELLKGRVYTVLRQQDTEYPFTGAFWNHHEKGVYRCAACGLDLFSSADKFDSGTGWPSYTRPVAPDRVTSRGDNSHGMVRDEVVCGRCEGHLGHVFDDGPKPTGLRYCINSASLVFRAGA